MRLVLATLLLLLAALLFVILKEEPSGAAGGPHDDIPAMSVGGDGRAKLAGIRGAAVLFHLGLHALAGLFVLLGIPEKRRSPAVLMGVGAATALGFGISGGMWVSYFAVLGSPVTPYFAGFPASSSWMIYGHWSATLAYDLVFIGGFRTLFLHPQDEGAFETLKQDLAAADREGLA